MGAYDFVLDGMVWSYSNLKAFTDCPYLWYMKYIECECDKRDNVYGQFGSFCHSLLEQYLKGNIEKNQLADKYEKEFYDNVTEIILDKSDPTEKLYNYGMNYFACPSIDRQNTVPIFVEKNIEFNVGKHKFRGIIDFMYKENDDMVILDHKTSDYPVGKNGNIKKSKENMMDGYIKQLALYAYGVEQVTGVRPKRIGWNFIRANRFYIIELTDKMVEDTLAWANETIDTIYNCEEFQKKESFMMCKTLCDLRGQC